MKVFSQRLFGCIKLALPKSAKMCLWLFEIILPLSLLVRLLQYYGVVGYLADFLHPFFNLVGLPGETAIVFVTSVFLPLYAAIAVMTSLVMSLRETTILTLMCLLAHNLPVECAVTKKTGSSFIGMFILRVMMAFVVAFFLNIVLPQSDVPFMQVVVAVHDVSIISLLTAWLHTSLSLILTIVLIVTGLMVLQRILMEFNLIEVISRPLRPLMKLFGLPDNSSFLWFVGNLVGLAYGGTIMADMVEEGKLSLEDSNMVNHHLAISHSLLEDTLLFVALGIPIGIIVGTRVLFAMAVVWGRKLIVMRCIYRK
ncbi:hypothetical protein EZS27_025973 [termite gut metagenome]|uniref:Nucleoside transporter/FeoB GTPase Gate domain-containing protein n=1 Tax=termite gut metagenome TaxID=433724 RepID=A0A5J4QVB4_9ZZZZ